MDKITFTLAEIKAHSPCEDGYKKLCKNLGGVRKYGKNTPITLRQLYESNGYDDTMWCLRTTPKETHNLWRHFAVDAASLVKQHMKDERSLNALDVARAYADGKATDAELAAAWADAWAAAAWAAARAAAWAAAWAAARAAARAAQIDLLEIYCKEGKRPENSEQLMKELYEKRLNEQKEGE